MKKHYGRLQTVLALFLAVMLLAGGACAQCFAAAAEGPAAVRNASAVSDKFLEMLADHVKKGEDAVDVSAYGVIYSDEVREEIADYFFNRRPDLFLLKAPVSFSYYTSGELNKVRFNYQYTVTEYASMLKKAEASAEQLLSGIAGNDKLTDVQKALLLHDRLAVWCEYDRGVLKGQSAAANARNIYGPLVERSGVCDGYTRTYIYLLGKVGIRSVLNRSDKLNHSWNIVWVGGKAYHVDVTFDDPTYDMTGRVTHDHFLLSSDALYQTKHAANDYNTEPSDTRYDNYFWQNSNAAFVLAQGQIYYIDNVSATLNRFDKTKVLTLSDDWNGWHSSGKQSMSCYARSASDGNVILYTDKTSVYQYDPASGKSAKVFTPSDPSGKKLIFGMALENGTVVCDFTASPNDYSKGKDGMRVTKAFTAHTHTWDGGKVTKAAAVGVEGEKLYTCTVCGATKTVKIPAKADQTPSVPYGPGDVDGNGKLESADARLALRASVKLENIPAGSAAFKAADADKDGTLSSADARLILRASVGLEKLA